MPDRSLHQKLDRAAILEISREGKVLSRTRIVKDLHTSPATVSRIPRGLRESGLGGASKRQISLPLVTPSTDAKTNINSL
jgi:hypothetical protein